MKLKHERRPLTSDETVTTMKAKFGSPGRGRNLAKRNADDHTETPRQKRLSVSIWFNCIVNSHRYDFFYIIMRHHILNSKHSLKYVLIEAQT